MAKSDWVKVGTFVVGLFVASGIPAAVHFGRKDAELEEVRTRVNAAEAMIRSTREHVDTQYGDLGRELREINTRLSRIEGAISGRRRGE